MVTVGEAVVLVTLVETGGSCDFTGLVDTAAPGSTRDGMFLTCATCGVGEGFRMDEASGRRDCA